MSAASAEPTCKCLLTKSAGGELPIFPYHKQIFELYIQDPSDPMWAKYTKLQEWITQVNDHIIQHYQQQFSLEEAKTGNGETYYNMLAGKPTLAHFD